MCGAVPVALAGRILAECSARKITRAVEFNWSCLGCLQHPKDTVQRDECLSGAAYSSAESKAHTEHRAQSRGNIRSLQWRAAKRGEATWSLGRGTRARHAPHPPLRIAHDGFTSPRTRCSAAAWGLSASRLASHGRPGAG